MRPNRVVKELAGTPHVVWKRISEKELKPFIVQGGTIRPILWAPQPGSQMAFIQCPVLEVLYGGTRGPGKTDALLMSYAQFVGKGFGPDWKGIIFRRTFKQLSDLIDKSLKWFKNAIPDAVWNSTNSTWHFKGGEQLLLKYMDSESDYWNYHGHNYQFIGWEELTNWPDDVAYKKMFSCLRSTNPKLPRMVRATCNPYGVGHNWVKARFKLPLPPGHMIGDIIDDSVDDQGNLEPARVYIHGRLQENRILQIADPDYRTNLIGAAQNEAELKAWLEGDWDIVAGGMFDDVWDKKIHVIEPFKIPKSWIIDRSFDWGSTKPFSVGWWAESDGSDVQLADGRIIGTVRGDLFRIQEWYGCRTNHPNTGLKLTAKEIARGIIQREVQWGIHNRVLPGVADSSIFDEENDNSIARDMSERIFLAGKEFSGIDWYPADKRSGSRKQGWQQMRKMLLSAKPKIEGDRKLPREHPGLFIFSVCKEFMRTVPVLPRDEKDLDDVDSDSEDHIADESRYRVRFERPTIGFGRARGVY